jgi:hypothetical protein
MTRVIVYSVGNTHTVYLQITEEEAARRWEKVRAGRAPLEIAYELSHNLKVERHVINCTDSFQIWGNAANELNDIVGTLLSNMGRFGADDDMPR